MTISLPIPDELAARLGEAGDVSRSALEAFGLTESRHRGHLVLRRHYHDASQRL